MLASSAATVMHRFCWYIPPELRDLIIDHLHTDRAALKACGLTCHAWLPRARYHLFHTVMLVPGPRSDAFKQLVHSRPIITMYIQEVEIRGAGVPSWWDKDPLITFMAWPTLGQAPRQRQGNESDIVEMVAWLHRILPPTTPPLANAQSLKFSAFPISNAIALALVPHFKNIRVLSFDGCKALAFADLIELLQAFPHVDTLRLIAAQWLPRSTYPQICYQSFPKLKRLEMSRKIDVAPCITWMLSESVCSEIASLSCSISGQNSATAIRDLLHAIGPTLEQLEIGFQETRDPTDVIQASHLDLTQCTGLRRLVICCSPPHYSTYQPSLSWVLILLSTANSSALKSMTFSIRMVDVCALNLEGLDVVLSHMRFKSLKQLIFDIEAQRDSSVDFAPEIVCGRMSGVNAKGIIRLDISPH